MTINTEYCNVRQHTLHRMHFVANSYNSLKHLVTQILVTQCLKHETICYDLYPDFGRPKLDSTTAGGWGEGGGTPIQNGRGAQKIGDDVSF